MDALFFIAIIAFSLALIVLKINKKSGVMASYLMLYELDSNIRDSNIRYYEQQQQSKQRVFRQLSQEQHLTRKMLSKHDWYKLGLNE